MPRKSSSGYLGVRWDANRKKFKVAFWNPHEYRLEHGGYFDNAAQAARRYDEMAFAVRGAVGLNFPPDAKKRTRNASESATESPPSVDEPSNTEVE